MTAINEIDRDLRQHGVRVDCLADEVLYVGHIDPEYGWLGIGRYWSKPDGIHYRCDARNAPDGINENIVIEHHMKLFEHAEKIRQYALDLKAKLADGPLRPCP
jgi:hypothetical protein